MQYATHTSAIPTLFFHKQTIALTAEHTIPQVTVLEEATPLYPDRSAQMCIINDMSEHNALLTQSTPLVWYRFREALMIAHAQDSDVLARGLHVYNWFCGHPYCSKCGHLVHISTQEIFTTDCPQCHARHYPRVNPVVIVAILRNSREILLARNLRNKDFTPMYSLIAGFVESGETIEQATHREVAEEVGLKINNLRYWGSQPWPFDTNIMLGFIADYESGDICIQEDELLSADFFDLDHLPNLPPPHSIAFKMIEAIKQRIRDEQH